MPVGAADKDGLDSLEGEFPMALRTMLKANIDKAPSDAHGKISKQVVTLDKVTAIKVTFNPGAQWSKDLKPYAKTKSCLLPHVAYVLSGKLHVVMDDGSEETFGKGDIMMLPPGHDAWAMGNKPCVFIQFSQGDNYYSRLVPKTHSH
ncbi:MAG: cupin domain-containing protein [Burkholderiales bacterium]